MCKEHVFNFHGGNLNSRNFEGILISKGTFKTWKKRKGEGERTFARSAKLRNAEFNGQPLCSNQGKELTKNIRPRPPKIYHPSLATNRRTFPSSLAYYSSTLGRRCLL